MSENDGPAIKVRLTVEEAQTRLNKILRLKNKGYSYLAISIMLDIPESTVRCIYSKEMEKLYVTD